jgi:hypothetical protein
MPVISCRHLSTALVAVATVLLFFPSEAPAPPFGSGYSWELNDDQNCTHPVDPIGLVFFGSRAESLYMLGQGESGGHIGYHTGWRAYGGEEAQGHKGPDNCTVSNPRQPAEAFGFPNSRYHIRLWGGDRYINDHLFPVMVATPHHEEWTSCGHAVNAGAVDRGAEWRRRSGSGFDMGRRRVMNRFASDPGGSSGRHPRRYEYWGNSDSRIQCAGWPAGSNGNVGYIGIGKTR